MHTVSICPKCQCQNQHEVDHNGEATITCYSCSNIYYVRTYLVRAKGGTRERSSGIKHFRIRVKEPDRDETLLEFDSVHEIEMRSGDWITASYSDNKLKYLLNNTIHRYWDVREGMGCFTGLFSLLVILIAFIILTLYII